MEVESDASTYVSGCVSSINGSSRGWPLSIECAEPVCQKLAYAAKESARYY